MTDKLIMGHVVIPEEDIGENGAIVFQLIFDKYNSDMVNSWWERMYEIHEENFNVQLYSNEDTIEIRLMSEESYKTLLKNIEGNVLSCKDILSQEIWESVELVYVSDWDMLD